MLKPSISCHYCWCQSSRKRRKWPEEISATALNARKQVSSWVREREGVDLAFPQSPAFTDLLCVEDNDSNLLSEARELGIHLGVEITERIPQLGKLIVKLSFSDLHNDDALKPLKKFLLDRYPASSSRQAETNPPVHLLRIAVRTYQLTLLTNCLPTMSS